MQASQLFHRFSGLAGGASRATGGALEIPIDPGFQWMKEMADKSRRERQQREEAALKREDDMTDPELGDRLWVEVEQRAQEEIASRAVQDPPFTGSWVISPSPSKRRRPPRSEDEMTDD